LLKSTIKDWEEADYGVRKALPQDAVQVIEVMKNAEDSGWMLFEPNERIIVEATCRTFISKLNKGKKTGCFVAVKNEVVYRYVIVKNERPKRIQHRGYIVIGIDEASRGKGVGTLLFQEVIRWAEKAGLHKLELTVITSNEHAVRLYENMGFTVEGVRKDSLYIDHHYVDEYYMGYIVS